MRKPLLSVIGLLGAVVLLNMAGCGGTQSIFKNISMNLDSPVELTDIHVSVHTASDLVVNQPSIVTASITSLHPLTSLTGSGQDLGRSPSSYHARRLDEILHPPSLYTGSYSLCLLVQLRLDDPSAFEAVNYVEQEFALVPDATTEQIAQWTVQARDTFGYETVSHGVTVGVWFDAETTCRLGNPSLLGDSFFLLNSSHSDVLQSTFTVVNEDLRQQRALAPRLQPIVVAAVAAATLVSVGWATGFFDWLPLSGRGSRKPRANEKRTGRNAARPRSLIVVVTGAALLSGGIVLITPGPSVIEYSLGTNATLLSFVGGIFMAAAGIVFLARGLRRTSLSIRGRPLRRHCQFGKM